MSHTIISLSCSIFKWFFSTLVIVSMVGNASAQSDSTTHQEVDSLIKSTNLFSKDSQMLKTAGEEILNTAGSIDYPKGLVYGNLLVARHLYLRDYYDKSISFLEQAQKEKEYLHSVPRLNAYLYYLYSLNYFFVGLRSPGKQYLHKALSWAKKEEPNSIQQEKLIANIYRKFMGQFSRVTQLDSVRYYINKYEEFSFEHIRRPNQAYTNIMRGRAYFLDGKIDSAYQYYIKGYKQIDNKKNHSYAISLLGLGRIAYQRTNYDQGVQYFLEGLQHAQFPAIKIAFYKYLADSYAKLGKLSKKYHYLERYKTNQDSFQTVNRTRRAAMFRHYYDNREYNNSSSVNTKIAVLTLLGVTLAAIGLFFFYRKNKRTKKRKNKRRKNKKRKRQRSRGDAGKSSKT